MGDVVTTILVVIGLVIGIAGITHTICSVYYNCKLEYRKKFISMLATALEEASKKIKSQSKQSF